jgi:DNA-binding MarR family transcriptional regulator
VSGHTAGLLPGLDAAEAKSWQNYLEAAHCFHSAQTHLLSREHQLSVVDAQVLDILDTSATGSARMGDLAETLEVLPSHLTKRVRRLMTQALVRQEPSPADRRGVLAIITENGREVARRATVTSAHGVRTHLIGPLPRSQVIALERNCRRISTTPVRTRPELSTRPLPGLDDIEVRCWRQFLDSAQRLSASVNSTLVATHQLTLADVLVLYVLAARDRSARMSGLARSLMLMPSRVTQQISRLESRGLVSRAPCPGDLRGVLVDITGQGRARAQPAVETYAKAIRTHYLDRLTREQIFALGDTCRRISTPLKGASLLATPKRA